VFDNAESAVRHAVANKLRIKSFYSEKELWYNCSMKEDKEIELLSDVLGVCAATLIYISILCLYLLWANVIRKSERN
jgi:hypothetical protein